MNAITGTWKDGRIILDDVADWPDGCRVVVAPAAPDLAGDNQADDPESIARWIAAFDAIPPLNMTPGEEAEWQAARAAQKQFEIATAEQRAKRIEDLFR